MQASVFHRDSGYSSIVENMIWNGDNAPRAGFKFYVSYSYTQDSPDQDEMRCPNGNVVPRLDWFIGFCNVVLTTVTFWDASLRGCRRSYQFLHASFLYHNFISFAVHYSVWYITHCYNIITSGSFIVENLW
jgi:hypothetical protein